MSKVTVDPDHLYDYAEMEPGNTLSLRNAPAGSARVLWLEESGSTERWAVVRLGEAEDVLRFQLLESLSRCGSALAKPVVFRDGKWCPVEVTLTVHDSIGVVCPDLCKSESTSGEGCDCPSAESVPAGTFGLAKRFEDSRKWEVVALGEGCCSSSSSSSGSSSSSSSWWSSSSSSSAWPSSARRPTY